MAVLAVEEVEVTYEVYLPAVRSSDTTTSSQGDHKGAPLLLLLPGIVLGFGRWWRRKE